MHRNDVWNDLADWRLIPALLAINLLAMPGSLTSQEPAVAIREGRLVADTVRGEALADNLLGDPIDQPIEVYLPPGYAASPDRRYPTLYLLHGFGGTTTDWTGPGYGMTIQGMMDSLVHTGAIREMIVVVPSGRNRYMGSFYMNSPVTGSWGDYVARDLVGHVDARYRSIPRAESRGIAGHSMGGFGAIWLGMHHPDVFSAVYALSPGVLALGEDLGPENPAWWSLSRFDRPAQLDSAYRAEDVYPMILMALAAVFSPNPDRPPFYVDLPYTILRGMAVPREPALSRWETRVPLALIEEFRDNLVSLRGLWIDYGFDDEFFHIPPTTLAFSRKLAEYGVPHVFEVYQGDHRDRMPARIGDRVLPFFSSTLMFEDR